jgi:hypothetical protein
MHAVMAGVINLARRQLIANFKEGEWPPTTAIATGFIDLLRDASPRGERQARRNALANRRAGAMMATMSRTLRKQT